MILRVKVHVRGCLPSSGFGDNFEASELERVMAAEDDELGQLRRAFPKSEERFRQVVELVPNAIFMIGPDGQIFERRLTQ